jgi:hypothetical protein
MRSRELLWQLPKQRRRRSSAGENTRPGHTPAFVFDQVNGKFPRGTPGEFLSHRSCSQYGGLGMRVRIIRLRWVALGGVLRGENYMARPTDEAIAFFDEAERRITSAGLKLHNQNLSDADRQFVDLEIARGLWTMAAGLSKMSTGLRATYILLEQVKAAVEKQK